MVRVHGSQRGFTLIEILIALLIGVFLLGALLSIVQANRAAFGDQNKLAQLQDSERMALSMMADVIQSAGYFPDPTHNTLDGTLIAAPPFAVEQSIYGTHSTTTGDTLYVRYMTAGSDGILNCSGLSNTNPVGGANVLYVNWFYISNGQLVCNMNGTEYDLVSGVPNSTSTLGITNLAVLYGVNTGGATAANNVDTYMTADLMTPANWDNVISVMIQLTFTNPLYTAGSTQPPTITIQRVVGVMNQLGPVPP